MDPQLSNDLGSEPERVGPPEEPRSLALTAVERRIEERRHSMELDELDLELLGGDGAALQSGATIDAGYSPEPELAPLPAPAPWSRTLEALAEWLYSLRVPARVGFLGLAVYLFAFNLSVVRGSSMTPGIHDGDRILIDQLSYVFSDVERGDIVVLRYPLDPSVDYIKRIVGLPGDEVVLAGGALWVNGERVEEDYVAEGDPYTHSFVRVKPGHFFVLGDNRLHSSDSREFGQVPEELLRGKVDLRLWPPARIGRLH